MCRIVLTQLLSKRCSSINDLGKRIQNSLQYNRMGMIVTLKTLNFSVVSKSWFVHICERLRN